MPWLEVLWIEGPGGNIEHIAQHGITTREVEEVLQNPQDSDVSESSGRPMVFGSTSADRFLAIVYEQIDPVTVYPITAFVVED